jgi:hypothetical protein
MSFRFLTLQTGAAQKLIPEELVHLDFIEGCVMTSVRPCHSPDPRKIRGSELFWTTDCMFNSSSS